jgi:hypothetical protein
MTAARVDGSWVEDQGGCGSCSWEANHFTFVGGFIHQSIHPFILRCFRIQKNSGVFFFSFGGYSCALHFVLIFYRSVFWGLFSGAQQCGENYGNRWAHWVCHEWSYCWCSDPCGTRSCWDTGWFCHLSLSLSLSLSVSHLIIDLIFWGWKSCWMCLSFLSLSQPSFHHHIAAKDF